MESVISLRVLLCTALLLPLCYCQVVDNKPNCNQNCTGLESEEFCATNGKTYNNTCEMNKESCLTGIDIQHQEDGPCVVPTVMPTKGEACKKRVETVRSQQKAICEQGYLWEKSESGNLTLRDLNQCFTPLCGSDENIYEPTQSHTLRMPNSPREKTYYWCSGPNGLAINGTLTNDESTINCSHRKSCQYEGIEYQDGSEFAPSHSCGICECLDGEVTCFDDFLPDFTSGRLNGSQLNQVSDWLKRFFYFQSNLRDAVIPDIRKIPITPILEATQNRKLTEAFNHYDKSGNGFIRLNHSEETGLHHHISQVTFCDLRQVLNHISEEFDTNRNGRISIEEWLEFFGRYTTEGGVSKRDVSEGSLARRMLTASQESIANKVQRILGASVGSTTHRVQKSTAPRLRRRSLESRKKFYYVTV